MIDPGSCSSAQRAAFFHDSPGKERDQETGLDYFLARYYSGAQGRFTGPDPMGGHYEDPQTLNRYAYVRNNPLRFTDPTGLDFYLTCTQTNENKSTCQNGHAGTTNDKGVFTATIITSASLQDSKSGNTATVNDTGVQIKTAQGAFGAEFIPGTAAADIQGSGGLAGFSFNINNNCDGSCLASGTFQFNGSGDEARKRLTAQGAWSYTFMDKYVNSSDFGFHPETDQFRFGSGPSPHLSVPWNYVYRPDYSQSLMNFSSLEGNTGIAYKRLSNPKATVPIKGSFHVDTGSGLSHGTDIFRAIFGKN
jgi:RHS repeat-associated protein